MISDVSHTHEPKTSSGQSDRLLLLFGLLLGFALRLVRLGGESLWYDETVSVALARKSIPDLIAHTAGDIHPPGYYLLLHAWQSLAHPTLAHGLEFLFAWPSLWFGLLILPLIYALGRSLFDRRVALIAVWIGAVHPFHVWYGQEVRMYTLGAALGLLALWSLVKAWERVKSGRSAWPWLVGYGIWAALGMYVLYYFLFLLVALNLIALAYLIGRTPGRGIFGRKSLLWPWLAAQGMALLLWLPWLPTFLRQSLDPPVPPWRVPWQNAGEFAHTVVEVLAAQLIGQTPPGQILWPYALATIALLLAGYAYAKNRRRLRPAYLITLYAFLPLALIFALTLLATPLYHVRYAFTYAPPVLILFAAGIGWLMDRRGWLGGVVLAGLLTVSGLGLVEFWANPLYRADDHRGAVAELATQWRPGDVILVNAGWAYTVLETYWPTELTGPEAALPPLLGGMSRLGEPGSDGVAVVRTGSVDGGSSLGWGSSDSDFFPISRAETEQGLARLAENYGRIWHYRLYDTVSDPVGVVRDWLAENGEMALDQPVSGRDFGRLQLFDVGGTGQVYGNLFPDDTRSPDRVQVGDDLLLLGVDLPGRIAAGEMLYIPTLWRILPGLVQGAGDLRASLRIYDDAGHLLAQQDGGFLPPTSAWEAGDRQTETLSLPLPAALPPGDYTIYMLIYHQKDGQPLSFLGREAGGNGLDLGEVTVQSPTRPVESSPTLARFDYIDLVEAQLARTEQAAAEPLDLRLIWRPGPSDYRDTYGVALELVDEGGAVVAQWQDALGGWGYPSGEWPAGVPVLEWKRFVLEPEPTPGLYTLTLGVSRVADGQSIRAVTGSWPWAGGETIDLGQIRVR